MQGESDNTEMVQAACIILKGAVFMLLSRRGFAKREGIAGKADEQFVLLSEELLYHIKGIIDAFRDSRVAWRVHPEIHPDQVQNGDDR
ncbi:MAG: hypothetical protein ACD_75C01416G0002 [uncultured bacterium]|nr:MAG: hypothetical protein ACD_75C01416G0002 [uncultured bacterium]